MDMLMNFVYQYGDVVQFFVWVFHYATLAVVAIVAVIWWVRVAKMKLSGSSDSGGAEPVDVKKFID